MGYEMTKLICDFIFGGCLLGLGIYWLVTPYEKLKEKNPKMKSEKTIKICAVLCLVVGVITLAMGVWSLF